MAGHVASKTLLGAHCGIYYYIVLILINSVSELHVRGKHEAWFILVQLLIRSADALF